MLLPDYREAPAGIHPTALFLWEKLLSQFPPFGPHLSSSSCSVTAVPGAVGTSCSEGEEGAKCSNKAGRSSALSKTWSSESGSGSEPQAAVRVRNQRRDPPARLQ